jgi:6,7-dimethyl-8-ribityllumazine synthase
MIKWVELTTLAKSPDDFRTLVRLLEALGLCKGFGGQNDKSISQVFLLSDAKLHLVHRKKPWNDSDLMIAVSDPDSASEIVKSLGLEITNDSSGPEPEHLVRNFRLKIGGTKVHIVGFRTIESTEPEHIGIEGDLHGAGKHFGIVVSRFNSFITERLLNGALDGLHRLGVNFQGYDIVRVPGAFEIPSAARTLAQTGKYDAIICLGCLLRGDTAHYDVIANEVTRGIGQSAQETGVPHAFGVLTCDTLEQAIDRAGLKSGNKGFEAALSAVEMANLKKAVTRQSSAVRGKHSKARLSKTKKSTRKKRH